MTLGNASFLDAIINYFESTPTEVIIAQGVFTVGWIPIFGVIAWGLSQIWVDNRQGIYASKMKWVLLEVFVPQDAIQTPKGIENFFATLAGSRSGHTWKEQWIEGKFQTWFSFEIVSLEGEIHFYIRTVEKYRNMVEAGLYAQYPEAQIVEQAKDYTENFNTEFPSEDWDVWGSEVKTKRENYLPIKTWPLFEHAGEKDQRFKDPLLTILEAMGKMGPGEYYCIQLLTMPLVEQDWTKAGEAYIKKMLGKPDTPTASKGIIGDNFGWVIDGLMEQTVGLTMFGNGTDAPKADDFATFKMTPQEREQVEAVSMKISKIGWLAKIRFVYLARKEVFKKGPTASLSKGLFSQYSHLSMNELGFHGPSTPNDDYFWLEWQMPGVQRDLVTRYKNRSFSHAANPYILNTEELATLWHFPAADARTPVLRATGARQSEPPGELSFAGVDVPDLPNIDRSAGTLHVRSPKDDGDFGPRRPLAVPSVSSPTGKTPDDYAPVPASIVEPAPADEAFMPKPGAPAPLPPGLSLDDEPIE
ncbi:MAG: hypothetical protein O3B64_03155 [bacterium]|nr:hypothetical protein [bacterium]MDA1024618.1 hypothetical protein [bacterium]